MSAEADIPSQFTHSIKLTETAKGIRIDVHVYANNMGQAVMQALSTYTEMRGVLQKNNIPLAPMEVENK